MGPLDVAVDLDLLDVSIHAPVANYSYHPNGRWVRKGVPKYIIFDVAHESPPMQVYWSQGGTWWLEADLTLHVMGICLHLTNDNRG